MDIVEELRLCICKKCQQTADEIERLRHELYRIQCNATNLVTMVEDGEAEWTDVIERLEEIIQIALIANRAALRGEEE